MIQHLHSLICGRSILDSTTGLASYIDIYEGITVNNPDHLRLPIFYLVSRFWVKEKIGDGQILLVEVSRSLPSKSKKRIVMQEMDFPLEKKGETFQLNLEVENLVVEETGLWEFEVRWKLKNAGNWKKGASIPIHVKSKKKSK